MKFEIGDKVRSKSEDKSGEILQCRYEKFKQGTGKITETIKYQVKTAIYHSTWYDQDDLIFIDSFDDDFESGFLGLLINVNLKENNLDKVKELHKQQQKYKKG